MYMFEYGIIITNQITKHPFKVRLGVIGVVDVDIDIDAKKGV